MGEVVRLSPRAKAADFKSNCLSVEIGQVLKLAEGVFMRLQADLDAETSETKLVGDLSGLHWSVEQPVPLEPFADLRSVCGLLIVPITTDYDSAGRVTRARLRFEQVKR